MKRNDTVGFEVRTLDNLLNRRMLAFGAKRGLDELTVMSGWILGYLSENQHRDIFQKNIETEFSISRSTVTGIVQLMEKKGYITRESVPQDGRLKRLVLTDKGHRMHADAEHDVEWMEEYICKNISDDELDAFFKTIRKIRKNLEDDEILNGGGI